MEIQGRGAEKVEKGEEEEERSQEIRMLRGNSRSRSFLMNKLSCIGLPLFLSTSSAKPFLLSFLTVFSCHFSSHPFFFYFLPFLPHLSFSASLTLTLVPNSLKSLACCLPPRFALTLFIFLCFPVFFISVASPPLLCLHPTKPPHPPPFF